MLKLYVYKISLCSRLISIYLDLLLILVHIMSLYYDILSFFFTSCYHTITSNDIDVLPHSFFFIVFFRQRHVLSVVHPVFIFRSIISVCFRLVNRKVRLNAEISTMADMTYKIELILYMLFKFQPGV